MRFEYPPDSPVTPIDAATFQAFIEKHPRVFIHFGAAWNGYDKLLFVPVVYAARDLVGKVAFAILDVDEKVNWNLLAEHKLQNVPYFEYYEDGKLTASGTGYDVVMKQVAAFSKKTH